MSSKRSQTRKKLATEMQVILKELVAAIERGKKAGLMDESDEQVVLEYMDRIYKELFDQYEEFTEVDAMLRDRVLTYSEMAAEKAAKEAKEAAEEEAAKALEAEKKAAAKKAKKPWRQRKKRQRLKQNLKTRGECCFAA